MTSFVVRKNTSISTGIGTSGDDRTALLRRHKGALAIRAPDVAFTPKAVYRYLTPDIQGGLFSPTLVVEVEDLSARSKLPALTDKFKNEYFPMDVELGWLIDPIGRQSTYSRKSKRSCTP